MVPGAAREDRCDSSQSRLINTRTGGNIKSTRRGAANGFCRLEPNASDTAAWPRYSIGERRAACRELPAPLNYSLGPTVVRVGKRGTSFRSQGLIHRFAHNGREGIRSDCTSRVSAASEIVSASAPWAASAPCSSSSSNCRRRKYSAICSRRRLSDASELVASVAGGCDDLLQHGMLGGVAEVTARHRFGEDGDLGFCSLARCAPLMLADQLVQFAEEVFVACRRAVARGVDVPCGAPRASADGRAHRGTHRGYRL